MDMLRRLISCRIIIIIIIIIITLSASQQQMYIILVVCHAWYHAYPLQPTN